MRNLLILVVFIAIVSGCQTVKEKEAAKQSLLDEGDRYYAAGDYRMAYDYYQAGIPFIPYTEQAGGQYLTSHSVGFQTADDKDEDEGVIQISVDSIGEECFYKAMDCLIKLEKYNHVLNRYELYLDYFPNYRGITEVVSNIKQMIAFYEERNDLTAAIRGYKLLIQIDEFNRDGREAQFRIAEYYYKQDHTTASIRYYLNVLEFFPDDKRIPMVLFRLGELYYSRYRGIYYDYNSLNRSQKYFQRFAARGEGELKAEAEEYLRKIAEKNAAKLYYKGTFYQRRGELTAARQYYEEVRDDYKETEWAVKAVEALIAIPVEEETEEE